MKIVFDFAGVLFHWQPRRMLMRVLVQHAFDDASAARWEAAIFQDWGGDWAEFDRGHIDVEPLALKIAARTALHIDEVRGVIDAIPRELQADAATVQLVHELADAGHELYFLSNMPAPFADHLEAQHDFLRAFRGGVFSARVHAIKPEAAIFRIAEQRFSAAAHELVFIDDVMSNVVAAREAGWRALQYVDAAQCRAALAALAAPATFAASDARIEQLS